MEPHSCQKPWIPPPFFEQRSPSAVDQQIALHRSLLRIEVDDGRLEHPVLVRTTRVDRQRGAESDRTLALMDVAMERERRPVGQDRLADRVRADRDERLAT